MVSLAVSSTDNATTRTFASATTLGQDVNPSSQRIHASDQVSELARNAGHAAPAGHAVGGTTSVRGFDAKSGDHTQLIDIGFSPFKWTGLGGRSEVNTRRAARRHVNMLASMKDESAPCRVSCRDVGSVDDR